MASRARKETSMKLGKRILTLAMALLVAITCPILRKPTEQ
jgi:hypothetical protein